jgi:hypothetical protein
LEANAATQTILLMYPLHFGRFGGHWNPTAFYSVMALYVLLGTAPFVLSIIGLLMYWNRSLVKKWRRARARVKMPLGEFACRQGSIEAGERTWNNASVSLTPTRHRAGVAYYRFIIISARRL